MIIFSSLQKYSIDEITFSNLGVQTFSIQPNFAHTIRYCYVSIYEGKYYICNL